MTIPELEGTGRKGDWWNLGPELSGSGVMVGLPNIAVSQRKNKQGQRCHQSRERGEEAVCIQSPAQASHFLFQDKARKAFRKMGSPS
jgi:hypothetical protein